MKEFLIRILATLIVVVLAMSCKKYSTGGMYLPNDRKFRFQLYTNKDFSDDTTVINFSIFIKKANNILFDSVLASMQIKEIPDSTHKLTIDKIVSVNDNIDLAAGFRYEIENVGNSSYTDTSKAGNPFKIIDFAFQ